MNDICIFHDTSAKGRNEAHLVNVRWSAKNNKQAVSSKMYLYNIIFAELQYIGQMVGQKQFFFLI